MPGVPKPVPEEKVPEAPPKVSVPPAKGTPIYINIGIIHLAVDLSFLLLQNKLKKNPHLLKNTSNIAPILSVGS